MVSFDFKVSDFKMDDFWKMFGPLLGAVIGAGAVVIANYFQFLLRERENLRAWFNQYFVFDGIDCLLIDVALMQHQLALVMDKVAKPKEIQSIPTNAIVRVAQLLGAQSLHLFFSSMHLTASGLISDNLVFSHDSDAERMDELITAIAKVQKPLVELRAILFSLNISRHSEISKIQANSEVIRLITELNTICAEAIEALTDERCMIQMASINGIL